MYNLSNVRQTDLQIIRKRTQNSQLVVLVSRRASKFSGEIIVLGLLNIPVSFYLYVETSRSTVSVSPNTCAVLFRAHSVKQDRIEMNIRVRAQTGRLGALAIEESSQRGSCCNTTIEIFTTFYTA